MKRQLPGSSSVSSFRAVAGLAGEATVGVVASPVELRGEALPLSLPPPLSLDGGVCQGLVLPKSLT